MQFTLLPGSILKVFQIFRMLIMKTLKKNGIIVFWTSHDFESNVQYLKTIYQRSSIFSVAPNQAGAPYNDMNFLIKPHGLLAYNP